MTKRIVLCADDYGQAEAISKGILELVRLGRLSAVSGMVNQRCWVEQAGELVPFKDKVDIGLHLNFTEGEPLSAVYRQHMGAIFMPLSGWLWRSMLMPRRLHHQAMVAEIHAQIDRFIEGFGGLPRFLDGHQHIHHLPGVREAVFEVYRQRLQGHGAYVRAVTLNWRWRTVFRQGIKPAVIHFTGGGEFANRLDSYSIPHNTTFAGLYNFGKTGRYRYLFQEFMQASGDRGMIMCHPGLLDSGTKDPIAEARYEEYQYFKSADFVTDCERFAVTLTKL